MPRLLMIFLMLGCFVLMPACDSGDSGDRAAGESSGKQGELLQPETREQAAERVWDVVSQFPDILSEVKDVESAEAAAGKLTDLAETIMPLIEQFVSFGDMSDDEADSLEAMYKQKIADISSRRESEMQRIAGVNPLLIPTVKAGLAAIETAMKDFDIDG